MFLSKNDRKLLRTLKKAQGSESCYVVVCADRMTAHHATSYHHSDIKAALSSWERFRIPIEPSSLSQTLQYLQSENLISKPLSGTVYQVTHTGWTNSQLRRSEILKMVVTHVLFPSAVAFITTLISIKLL